MGDRLFLTPIRGYRCFACFWESIGASRKFRGIPDGHRGAVFGRILATFRGGDKLILSHQGVIFKPDRPAACVKKSLKNPIGEMEFPESVIGTGTKGRNLA